MRLAAGRGRTGLGLAVAVLLACSGAAAAVPAAPATEAASDVSAVPAIFAASPAAPPAHPGKFTPPVAPVVVRPFDPPSRRWAAGHRGVDLAAVVGQEILAPAGGTVSFAGQVVDRVVLSITHANGLISSFEPVASPLPTGTVVTAGEVIATVAASNHCNACVHWGVRHAGVYIDPMSLLSARPKVVLLPLSLLDQ